ncbi:AAA family ATPase [Clostridium hydrogeniformans]|uniref:AAA family ATPase n=1 Tax=Clostridium hydrogeniformans TaxID=349933 RepID=UPI00047FFCCC|nr:AAA family ATPase [Clostridium hydrogeniformans]
MIHSIEIKDFRALKNVNINLGKYITAISGRNGLGKSTILALLGNTCELKVKEGKTLFDTQFRTEFSEIFKASKEFDKSGSDKFKVNFNDISNPDKISDCKISRVTWQKGKRFRVIPETKNEKEKNSRKKELPSIYLGLSRLYPIGEVSDEEINIKNIKLEEEEEIYFVDNYIDILNLKMDEGENLSFEMIDIGRTRRKKGIGVCTSTYSSITNSAGQDNIGQIIMSILSFRKLSKNNKNYNGGLLLIDEIDAALHPIAQIKLVRFLYKACKELKLQVVFTTHSVSLLKYLCSKVLHNKNTNVNNYEIHYLTTNNGPLKVLRNTEFPIIENDLMLSQPGSNIKKITVYSEDSEGRWFFQKLTEKYSLYLDVIKVKLSYESLLQLNKNDPLYFSNVLFVLDGDVKSIEESGNSKGNIIKLPGEVRPEQVIYEFLLNLSSDSQLWENGLNIGFSKESIEENGPLSQKFDGKDRERYKKWFNENLGIIESLDVFGYWIKENEEMYNNFIERFKSSYNTIAKRKLSPIIK